MTRQLLRHRLFAAIQYRKGFSAIGISLFLKGIPFGIQGKTISMNKDEWLEKHGIKPVYLVIAYILLLFLIGCLMHALS